MTNVLLVSGTIVHGEDMVSVELVLDEAGYEGDSRQRLLDPTCGSGGFLLRAIARMGRRYSARGEPAPR